MGIFSRCQIAFEFDATASFKSKASLKKKIIDNDGVVSFIVTKKVNDDRCLCIKHLRLGSLYHICVINGVHLCILFEKSVYD